MKNILKLAFKSVCVSALLFQMSCGKNGNLFESTHKKTAKENAKELLSDGDCQGAQDELVGYLAENPEDNDAKTMYSTAVMACADLDTLDILASMAGATDTSGSNFKKLIDQMPAGTQENVDKLGNALAALQSIPADQRTSAQNYQIAVVSASLAATTAKMVATDENGKYDPAKASTMTEAEASAVISAISTSSSALQASGGDAKQTEALSNVINGINNAPGSSNKEKLSDYLQKNT